MKIIDQKEGQGWVAYHADCVDVVRSLPSESVGHCVFSPPFQSLYTYSALDRDMGNCPGADMFSEHFAYLLPEIFRVLKPGRSVAMHCMELPASKTHDGFIGLQDFPGDLIRAAQRAGFHFHSRTTIWKDPVTAMQRTKALGLLWKQLKKDSAMTRTGIPDYLIAMRKPGANPEPIEHAPESFPVREWQRIASPIWDRDDIDQKNIFDWMAERESEDPGMLEAAELLWRDINPSDTLQFRSAREHNDERHICLAAGSLVLTREHGYLEIEDVEPGDHVLTHMGRWKPVLAKQCNGVAETIRTTAQGVADLRTTPDHKLWTRVASGSHPRARAMETPPTWEEARDTLGSYVNLRLPPEEPSALTPHEWWIVGRWLGDGHRGGHRRSGKRGGLGQFYISCAHDEAEDLIAKLGSNAGHVGRVTATQIAIINLRDEVRDVLDRCGTGAANKRLPGEAVALPIEESEALLAGYLSADGHHVQRHDRTQATSVSRALLLGMAMVAQRCRGVVASVYAGRPDREGEIQGRLVHMCQDWVMGFRNSDGYRKSGWIDDLGAWKKVRKIEECGEAEVWDLKVLDDESFTAEGAVVHNCPLQLDVIRRSIRLWSNPGDIILTPFGGIGSEGVVAMEMGRRAILAELKGSYYKQLARNMAIAERRGTQPLGELFAAAFDSARDADVADIEPEADGSMGT